MQFKYLFAIFLVLVCVGFASAETFTPDHGNFAYREVEIFDINGINFTVPTDYKVSFENGTEMHFKNHDDNLTISVVENGKVDKVKENKTNNITSGKTMLGPVEGYLVDSNGTYTFSYKENDRLVVIKSENMPLMIGVIEKDY